MPAAPTPESLRAVADRARTRGNDAAPIWLVEVSDFQCPYCRLWHEQTYPVVLRDYVATGRVRMAYMHLPVPTHAHAWDAAVASMCAAAQNRFWEFHDALFETQEAWSELAAADSAFAALARRSGLDQASWESCRTGEVMDPLLMQDVRRAQEAGVRSTPTFFIGDTAVVGALPPDVFRGVIEAQLAKGSRAPR